MKQKLEAQKNNIKRLKDQKLAELKAYNVKDKYVTDLEKYKLK